MRTVWKYTLDWTDQPQTLMIPYKSMVLMGPHFAVQNGVPCLWAEVETDDPPQEYEFHIRGTGHAVPEHVDYLGSTLMEDGALVWHLFLTEDGTA